MNPTDEMYVPCMSAINTVASQVNVIGSLEDWVMRHGEKTGDANMGKGCIKLAKDSLILENGKEKRTPLEIE